MGSVTKGTVTEVIGTGRRGRRGRGEKRLGGEIKRQSTKTGVVDRDKTGAYGETGGRKVLSRGESGGTRQGRAVGDQGRGPTGRGRTCFPRKHPTGADRPAAPRPRRNDYFASGNNREESAS